MSFIIFGSLLLLLLWNNFIIFSLNHVECAFTGRNYETSRLDFIDFVTRRRKLLRIISAVTRLNRERAIQTSIARKIISGRCNIVSILLHASDDVSVCFTSQLNGQAHNENESSECNRTSA